MTTLPQTTPLRLPTVQTGAVAPVPMPMGAPFAPTGRQMTFNDVMRVIRANMWLIVILVGVSAVAGFFINRELAKRWPKYTATGLVEIETRILIDPLNNEVDEISDTRLSIEQRKHAELLREDYLFSEALKNPHGPIRQTQWFKEFKHPDGTADIKSAKEDLGDHLSVTAIPETGLVKIGFQYKIPQDCQVIVEEIVKVHLDQQRVIAENQFNAQTRQLNEMKTLFDSQVREISQRTLTAMQDLATRGLPVGRSNFSALESEHQNLHKNALEIEDEMDRALEAFTGVKTAIDKGETPSEVERAIEQDPQLVANQRELNQWEFQREMLLMNAGPESPAAQRVNKGIELVRKQVEDRRQELRIRYREELMSNVRRAYEMRANNLKKKNERLEALKKLLGELRGEEARLLVLMEREKELREMQMQVENKIRDLASVSDPASRASVKWARHPTVPEIPSFPKLPVTMTVSVMIGLFLALGIAFLRELMDDTVRTPRDITRVGQLNLLGIIADESDDPMVADTRLPIFDAPQSLTAEQFRQVRTRMAHASPLDTTRTIMVTGPSPLDGKTTVAANLAAGLALNGRKILLVDSNFRRPEVHRLFGASNDRGFADVLNGTAAFDEVVAASRVPNLFVMPSGPKPMNATELFESQLLIDFIDRALEEYDHVIFDSGPFLIVSEAQALAPRVDGVVTVVRAHSESRGLLHRMRDSLRQVKAEHIGVVLNAVRAQGGGYYRRSIKQFYNYQSEV